MLHTISWISPTAVNRSDLSQNANLYLAYAHSTSEIGSVKIYVDFHDRVAYSFDSVCLSHL